MFDHAAFAEQATQLRAFADDYAALGLTADQAAQWANHGFMPHEANVWLTEGHTADRASYWASRPQRFTPAEGRDLDDLHGR